MGLSGELLSLPVKLANVPLKVIDEILSEGDEDDGFLSKPLDTSK